MKTNKEVYMTPTSDVLELTTKVCIMDGSTPLTIFLDEVNRMDYGEAENLIW
jgi:hypothetical protein